MKREEVTLDVVQKFLELIGYSLSEIPKEDESHRSNFDILDNLGRETGYVVNDELLEINLPGSQICFWLDECWIETIDDDAVSITDKEDNSGIFVTFSKLDENGKSKRVKERPSRPVISLQTVLDAQAGFQKAVLENMELFTKNLEQITERLNLIDKKK